MANRFQQSANRIINGRFGTLKKPMTVIQSDGFDYDNQLPIEVIVAETTALKRNLSKFELESQDIQLGDFALIFTDALPIDVDRHSGIYDGVAIDFISNLSLAADAGQTVIARIK